MGKILSNEIVEKYKREALACQETHRGDGLVKPMLELIESHNALAAALLQVEPDEGMNDPEPDETDDES